MEISSATLEIFMRTLLAIALVATLSACATQTPPPAATTAPATQAAAKPEVKAPQCWSGDESKLFNFGSKAVVSGINVECKSASDGKAAQWMSAK